jgi:molecular chaperone HscB
MIDFSHNHFDLFGLPATFHIDPAVLDRTFRELQSEVHPDRFAGGSDAEKRLALQSSARVNEAYNALRNPVQRAQYLLRLRGFDAVDESDTALPLEFLERQLERREQADEARAAGDVEMLTSLLEDARAEGRALESVVARLLDEQAFAAARIEVRQLTFLAKLVQDLDAMLASAES